MQGHTRLYLKKKIIPAVKKSSIIQFSEMKLSHSFITISKSSLTYWNKASAHYTLELTKLGLMYSNPITE